MAILRIGERESLTTGFSGTARFDPLIHSGLNTFTASGLSVELGGRSILQELTFEAQKGHWVGLLGPNGAGKTTLLRSMAGLLPYRGSLCLAEREVREYRPRERARRLAFVRQTHALSFDFRVDELVLLGRSPHKSIFSVFERSDHERVRRALSLVDLEGLETRPVSSLSGGEVQRVFLAQALVQEADTLLLDEPTTHLDVHHQYEFLERVREFVDGGMTVVGAFHDLEIAARYSDRLIVLRHGRLVASGTPADVLNAPLIADVFKMQAETERHASGDLRIRYDGPLGTNR